MSTQAEGKPQARRSRQARSLVGAMGEDAWMNLLQFLHARFDEDERAARVAGDARALREVGFKRELCASIEQQIGLDLRPVAEHVRYAAFPLLGRLAAIYADHCDYDIRWTQ
jgi:hypothetical protein